MLGEVQESYTCDAFGNSAVLATTATTGNPFTYNAEHVDTATNHQYLRARYYDSKAGGFLSEDSYKGSTMEPLSQNLYSYAENNPVNFDDPSGHGIFSRIKKGVSNLYNKGKTLVKKAATVAKKVTTKVAVNVAKRTAPKI